MNQRFQLSETIRCSEVRDRNAIQILSGGARAAQCVRVSAKFVLAHPQRTSMGAASSAGRAHSTPSAAHDRRSSPPSCTSEVGRQHTGDLRHFLDVLEWIKLVETGSRRSVEAQINEETLSRIGLQPVRFIHRGGHFMAEVIVTEPSVFGFTRLPMRRTQINS
jgi:hypothetical protein